MKKTFLYFCLLFIVQTAFAADSLYVREQQIPILIDRIDNVLYEMRIPAQKGDVLNEITIQIGLLVWMNSERQNLLPSRVQF